MTGGRAADLARRIARPFERNRALAAVASAVAVIAVAAVTAFAVQVAVPSHAPAAPQRYHAVVTLPAQPDSYLGAYVKGTPKSYAPLESLAAATGTQPDIALYYSGWREPFQAVFAREAVSHGAVPMIQIEPGHFSLVAIAAGVYDRYLTNFADAVAQFGEQTGHGVVIGFAHEPNGSWYPWGYRHATPAAWIAAWRHVVTLFRTAGARNVTWLWTVNIMDRRGGIPSPSRWWPGKAYVNWVGIDGYYLKPTWEFAPLFGPTIKAVRALTVDPILISETAATQAAGKAAKIANLFAGIHAYGLLGFVWFDVNKNHDWRLDSPTSIAAYRAGAATFTQAGS